MSDPNVAYELTYANGANDLARANKVFVYDRGTNYELLFAWVAYETLPPNDMVKGKGEIVKRIAIPKEVAAELIPELAGPSGLKAATI